MSWIVQWIWANTAVMDDIMVGPFSTQLSAERHRDLMEKQFGEDGEAGSGIVKDLLPGRQWRELEDA